ncbi:hypothetical protein [Segatella bryantii]
MLKYSEQFTKLLPTTAMVYQMYKIVA